MSEPDYDRDKLSEAYFEHADPYEDPFCSWTQFKNSYGENARQHFLQALDAGDIEVVEIKHGIRASGHWPNLNKGNARLEFNY